MVLCHDAARVTMKGYDASGLPVRPLRELVRIYEDAAAWRSPPGHPAARVVAVALNTGSIGNDDPSVALSAIRRAAAEVKLPAADPIREGSAGADRLARALIEARDRGSATATTL